MQSVNDLALSPWGLGSLLQLGFNPWPCNFHMPWNFHMSWGWQKQKTKHPINRYKKGKEKIKSQGKTVRKVGTKELQNVQKKKNFLLSMFYSFQHRSLTSSFKIIPRYFFFLMDFFFFFWLHHGSWKFLGQGSNPSHYSDTPDL